MLAELLDRGFSKKEKKILDRGWRVRAWPLIDGWSNSY
jgi:hypothetical protein